MENYPSLLITKITMPKDRPSQVVRSRLMARLDGGLGKRLILVAAAAGFGKTTLVSSWARQFEGQVGWHSLDGGDNDPVRFLSYVVAAVQQPFPDFGLELLAALQSQQPPSLVNSLYSLVNALSGLKSRLILVLDDYHVIEETAVHEALSFLLEHMPSHITLVVMSRSDPPLPLSRLRARNDLVELRAEQLRFSGVETAEFLNQSMALDLSVEAAQALETRTEGWIAGLQLAAIALQNVPEEREGFIEAFTGSHRFVLDYLMEEVLTRQPQSVRDFLVKTSFLHRVCAPLGDALFDEEGKSERLLVYLEKHNLFLIALDQTRSWFRYHHLFADLLQTRLVDEMGDEIATLRLRTAEWHEANNLPEEAVAYALEASDYDYAARLIAGPAATVFQRGEISRLLSWYKTFPPAFFDDKPVLCLQFGLAFALNGRWAEAERLLAIVEDADSAEIDIEGLIVLSFLVASNRQDISALLAIVEKAKDGPKPGPPAKTILSLIHFLLGDYETTSRLMTEAQREAEEAEDWAAAYNALLQHCRMRVYMGDLHESHRLCLLALERSKQVDRGLISQISLAYSVLGRIYIEWDEPEKAAEYLNQAIETGEKSGFRTGMLSSSTIMLAEVEDARGKVEAAQETADEALILARRHDPAAEVEWLKSYQARLWLNQGQLSAAAGWLAQMEKMEAERPLPVSIFYPGQIRLITKARILLGQRKTAEAITILTALTAEQPTLLTVEAYALLALARQANGDSVHAQLALEQTLLLAEPENRIRLFLNLGRPMVQLLEGFKHQAAASHPFRPFVDKLLERFTIDRGSPGLFESLSERELEILGLIVAGQSNQEIADSLFLALSTVKWYINTIYGKLQVKSRSQAIAKAHELSLIPNR